MMKWIEISPRRRLGAVAMVVVAGAMTLGPASTAVAARPPISGAVSCSVTGAALTFAPPLQNPESAAKTSRASLSGTVGACSGPASTPAPGGIDHGVLVGRDRLRPATCNVLDDLSLNVSVKWYDTSGRGLGTTRVRGIGVVISRPGFYEPWTFAFSGSATDRSKAFANEPAAVAFTTTSPNWAISANCGKVQLSGLSMVDGASLDVGV
jgi:hypothetical protein